MVASDVFCIVAREEFEFLVSQYGFVAEDSVNEGWGASRVTFETPRLSISVYRNFKDGFGICFLVKADTFWIRPASTRYYEMDDLLWMMAPRALYEVPGDAAQAKNETELRPILHFWADQIKKHGVTLLQGDLGLCEDMLITAACQAKSATPLEEHIKVFREESVTFPASERERIEAAFASKKPLSIWRALEPPAISGTLLTDRLLQELRDFRGQYLNGVSE